MIELLREYWDWFLFDTLLWTGALIALALVLRRPVARHLGAQASYALWFLPLLRLLFPPLQLPASMKLQLTDPAPAMVMEDFAAAAAIEPVAAFNDAAPAMMAPAPLASPVDLVLPLIALWLVGAAIFLWRRFWLYGQLRRDLLDDARPVGDIGRIRLIETPIISGPMAFGVIDKVIALPAGFMTTRDRQIRDLAIAHELAHHRGHDLLVNVLIQPLFALHWFNPLGWMGWKAMRRDQEAACDARVVASRSREERAAYAAIIADFARRSHSAPRTALAAPMACPVLGDKSIIHRLRSLPMTDGSRRRRLAARGTFAAALLALPLTASICYSEAVAAPGALALAPEPPSAPFAPLPPAAPPAPEAPELERDLAEIDRDLAEAEREAAEAEKEFARAEREVRIVERDLASGDAKRIERHRIVWNGKHWDEMSAAERRRVEKDMKQLRKEFAPGGEFQKEMRQLRRELAPDGKMHNEIRLAVAEANAAGAHARAIAPTVVSGCKDENSPVTSETAADGRTTLYVCESFGDRVALKALRSARAAIAGSRHLSHEERDEALRELDEEIAELSRQAPLAR